MENPFSFLYVGIAIIVSILFMVAMYGFTLMVDAIAKKSNIVLSSVEVYRYILKTLLLRFTVGLIICLPLLYLANELLINYYQEEIAASDPSLFYGGPAYIRNFIIGTIVFLISFPNTFRRIDKNKLPKYQST